MFFVFLFGGFKGQVRWPKGPPHLALTPPYLFFMFFLFSFLSLLFNTKKTLFSPRKGHFYLFSVFLFLSPLAFFGLPLFLFLFLCLSLFFFSFFLPSCLFLSFSFFFALFHERNNIKIFNCKFFLINIFSRFWGFPLFFSFKSLFLILAIS